MLVIIGKNGQLARKCLELITHDEGDDKVLSLGREEIDITSDSAIAVLDRINPEVVINASAYTAVDLAELDENKAQEINYLGVRNLSRYCDRRGIHFVHVSTDYVFRGNKGAPYLPLDNCEPINVYGKSKLLGENAIIQIQGANKCILRTSWVYSEFNGNFLTSMLKLMATKDRLSVISDQVGCPTSVDTLAKVCIKAAKEKLNGIHHVTDEGVASWYDFAKSIQRLSIKYGLLNCRIPIDPIGTIDYPTPAKRPLYSVLCKNSLKVALPGVELPYWQDALALVLMRIKAKQ